MNASPLGRYSELAATATALVVLAAWAIVHITLALGLVQGGADSSAIDTAATLVIGVVLGQRATTNGAGKIAQAAHERIDVLEHEIGAASHPAAANGGA